MKRILVAMLIISMTAGMTLQNVKASNEEVYYSESQMESIAQNYTENESLFEKCLCSDEGIAYWKMMHKMNEDHTFSWALDISSKMIDEYPDEQRYAEILSCLISMQTGEIVEQVSNQSRFDNVNDIQDLALDALDIAHEIIGDTGIIDSIGEIIGKTEIVDSVNEIAGAALDSRTVIADTKELAKYYEIIFQDYAESTMFLDAIVSYSENSELKEVAEDLKKAGNNLLAKRVEYLADVNGEWGEFGADAFYDNLGVDLLKQSELYNTDNTVKFFTDKAIEITETFSDVKLAFNGMLCLGNLAAGTNNTYNRYQEMKVVADISDALVKASEAVEVPNDTTADQVNALNEKCYYYKSLIVNHARGEYLVHQLLMKDAEGVSSFRWLKEYFSGNGMKTDEWYDSQIEVLVKCYDTINNIFHVDAIHDDIEISDYLKSYDQLKELLAMRPVDYWQFSDAESYMVDDFYVEYKDGNFSMKNEGASYVKLYGINLGDSMENAGQSLTENGWAAYSEDASGHSYLAMIEGEPYYVMLESDENGNLQDWYLNNWPEGDGIAEALENLKGGKTENPELYDAIFREYQNAVDTYTTDGADAVSAQFPEVSEFLISKCVDSNLRIWYGYYDIDGNGIQELLFSYETIEGTEYKIVDVFSQDGKSIQRVGEDDTFSENTGSCIYTSGVIYSSAGGQDNYYKINVNGYSLDKIEHPSELGAEISVDWKLLEITKNEPLQEDTSSNENIMSAEEVYEKLAEHYAQGTIDSPGDDLAVMEGSVNGTTYSTTVRCGMPGNPSASQALYEVNVDMVTGIASQTRMLLPDGNVVQFSLRDN